MGWVITFLVYKAGLYGKLRQMLAIHQRRHQDSNDDFFSNDDDYIKSVSLCI